jgi:hypothetical protein
VKSNRPVFRVELAVELFLALMGFGWDAEYESAKFGVYA